MKLIILLIMIFVIFGGLGLVSNTWERGQDRQACAVFAEASNRETKFVEYTHWSWDCLTPQSDGLWISAYNLRGE